MESVTQETAHCSISQWESGVRTENNDESRMVVRIHLLHLTAN
nr:MAG TPA: hypothetical protein [Bacteriophage sp.]